MDTVRGVRGWVDVDTYDMWCVRCCPTPGEVRRWAGLAPDDVRLALRPVDDEWADRQPLRCRACGRAL